LGSWDSEVSIVIRLQTGSPGLSTGQGFFLFTTTSSLALVPASYPMSSKGSLQPGSEADHSPLTRAKVKNVLCYTSISPSVFMVWCFVKYRIHLHGMVLY